jgi:hypothetical protein
MMQTSFGTTSTSRLSATARFVCEAESPSGHTALTPPLVGFLLSRHDEHCLPPVATNAFVSAPSVPGRSRLQHRSGTCQCRTPYRTTPSTSAPGPLPHLRRDPCHICAGTRPCFYALQRILDGVNGLLRHQQPHAQPSSAWHGARPETAGPSATADGAAGGYRQRPQSAPKERRSLQEVRPPNVYSG